MERNMHSAEAMGEQRSDPSVPRKWLSSSESCVLGHYGIACRIQGAASRHAVRTGVKMETKGEKCPSWIRDPGVLEFRQEILGMRLKYGPI